MSNDSRLNCVFEKRRSEMLPKHINYTSLYYSFLGFQFEFYKTSTRKLTNSIILLVHIAICTWCSFCTFETAKLQMGFIEFLDVLNFLLYCSTCSLLYWLLIYDSLMNRSDQIAFWQFFTRIDKKFYAQSELKICSYLVALFLLLLGDAFIFIFAFVCNELTDSRQLMHGIFFVIHDHRTFFYLLHLKIITFQLRKLNTELIQFSKCRLRSIGGNFCNDWFKWIRDYYTLVYKMTDHVNMIFGWSQLALFILCFYSAIVYINAIYRQFNGKFSKLDSRE